jgi:mannose-6-phosphate isomerase-like protein (cupin superfamily)
MKYYVDLDNTLCFTENSDYVNSVPIPERIAKVNELKAQGHTIVIWTARGAVSKRDWMLFTAEQLKNWGVQYDVLSLEKPSFDYIIDDKAFNCDDLWKIPNCPPGISKVTSVQEIVPKTWGQEIVIVNNEYYCMKVLSFRKGYQSSLHFHREKMETWMVQKGKLLLTWIDKSGTTYSEYMLPGQVTTHFPGQAHHVEALEDTDILECSTTHRDEDTYRIYKR